MKKQNIGEPCNGCGTCCNAQVCMNGAYVIGLVKNLGDKVSGACPAIVRSPNGNIRCGILLNPNKYIKKSKYPAKILSKYFGHLNRCRYRLWWTVWKWYTGRNKQTSKNAWRKNEWPSMAGKNWNRIADNSWDSVKNATDKCMTFYFFDTILLAVPAESAG